MRFRRACQSIAAAPARRAGPFGPAAIDSRRLNAGSERTRPTVFEGVARLARFVAKIVFVVLAAIVDRCRKDLCRCNQPGFSISAAEASQHPNKLYAEDIGATIMAALAMPRRALWPELAVFANNPWKED